MSLADFLYQGLKTRFNIANPALSAPVPLSRKINYEFGISELAPLEHKHLPRLKLLTIACGGISLEVVGKGLFELQRDTTAHYTYAVDGVDECFRV